MLNIHNQEWLTELEKEIWKLVRKGLSWLEKMTIEEGVRKGNANYTHRNPKLETSSNKGMKIKWEMGVGGNWSWRARTGIENNNCERKLGAWELEADIFNLNTVYQMQLKTS